MSCSFARNSRSGFANASSSAALSQQFASASASASASAGQSRRSGLSRSQSYAVARSSPAAAAFNSSVEQQVIAAQRPIEFNEREQTQAGPYRGTYLNKQEAADFRGPIPIEQYRINEDANPEVIRKRLDKVRYTQEVAVRYLNPPQPQKPGDLIIRERQQQVPAAPPVVLRQEGCKPRTPLPLVYREAPPRRPPTIPEQTVEVEGAPIPPPARRVVFEKLSNLPPKPQNILIEKWLPYKPQKRRVVFQRSCAAPPPNPRNLVIEWEAPEVEVEKVCRELGVVDADPEEYVRRYGNELKNSSEIPNLCPSCPPQQRTPTPAPAPQPEPCGCQYQQQQEEVVYAAPTPAPATASYSSASASAALPELEGDVDALRRVNLEQYGLSGYRRYIQ